MKIENYIQPGDEICVMFRSLLLDGFKGTVVEVGSGEAGKREFIIVRAGTTLMEAGAWGVREDAAVFSVRRGDCWVNVPSILTIEEATAKAARNLVNQVKRIQSKVPLFADQIEPKPLDPAKWVAADLAQGEERLEQEHNRAAECNELRSQVQSLLLGEQFAYLCERRQRYPQDGLYGSHFWRKQLEHIQTHGCLEASLFLPETRRSLSIPWIEFNKSVVWTVAPGGPQTVRVLWIGSTEILCQVEGEPIRDYDPKLIPHPNVWLTPDQLTPQQ